MLRRVGVLALFAAFTVVPVCLGASQSFASAQAREVDVGDIKAPALEVFLEVDATSSEVAAVEKAIRTTPGVRRYEHLDKDDAYAEFKRIFVREPGMIASVRPSDLPESFRLDLVAGQRKPVQHKLQSLPGVKAIDAASGSFDDWSGPELERARTMCADGYYEVFMNVDATSQQIQAVDAAIKAEKKIDLLRVVDPATAYQEFREAHVSVAQHTSVTAADLPTSFRVALGAHPDSAVIARLRALSGVSAVASPAAVCDWLVDHDR